MKLSHVILSFLVCAMFMGAVFALFKFEPPNGAREALLILIGALGAAFGQVISFWFGSSSGSARKDELLANSAPVDRP